MTQNAQLRNTPVRSDVVLVGSDLVTVGAVPVLTCRWDSPTRLASIAELLLSVENDVLSLPRAPNWASRLGNETSARFAYYNVLTIRDPLVKHVFDVFKHSYHELLKRTGRPRESMYIQCWMNILRRGESLPPHAHPFPYHGHLTVQTDGSATCYGPDGAVVQTNEAGGVTLLGGPGLMHEVATYTGGRPRISIAFDLLPLTWVTHDQHWRAVWHQRSFIPFD